MKITSIALLFLVALVCHETVSFADAVDLKRNLRAGESVVKLYRHQALVKPRKGAEWKHATYYRRPSVKVPKLKGDEKSSVSLIGSGEAGERFKIECDMQLCDKPSKMIYIQNDGKKMVTKSIEVLQDFNLDMNPNYLIDIGSGHKDTVARLMSANSILVYAKKTTSPIKEPMLFYKSIVKKHITADGVDYWIREVQEFLDLYMDNLKWAAMKRSHLFGNGEEVTKAFAPAANALQHRLKKALEHAKRAAKPLPPKELNLLKSLINSLCDTFNEMAAWDIEMAKIYSQKSYISTKKYNTEIATIAKTMDSGLPKRTFSKEMGGAFKSGAKAGVSTLVKSLSAYVENDQGRDPVEKMRTLKLLKDPNTVKVLSGDLFSAMENSKAFHGIDNRFIAINKWFTETAESMSNRIKGKKAEAKIATVIEKGGPSAFDHKFTTCAGSGVELREKGKLAPGEESVVDQLKQSYSRGLEKNQVTFKVKPNVKGLLDKIQLHTDMTYLTNYTSTKIHMNVDMNNMLMSDKASMDINTGIHHTGISKDGSLGWTAGANARMHIDGVLAAPKLTHVHLNGYITVKKKLDGDRTISSGFFISRNVDMPTGRFDDAMKNGGVLDRFHHELSYTNEKSGLKFSTQNTYMKKHNVGESFFSGVQVSKKDAFGVKNLEMFANAGFRADKTYAGTNSWDNNGGQATVGIKFKW
jgi:hypothetical protein